MNVKPAPFAITPAVVGHVIRTGDLPARGVTVMPLLPTKLVDEVRGMSCPADVPAVLRPDCCPVPRHTLLSDQGNVTISGFSPRPAQAVGRTEHPRVALLEAAASAPAETPNLGRPDSSTIREYASRAIDGGSDKAFRCKVAPPRVAPAPRREKIALPPLKDPRSVIVVKPRKPLPPFMPEVRRAQITAAIAYLKQRGILVRVWDRDAEIRMYGVTGKADAKLHEEVIQIAVAHGFEVPA